MHNLKNGSDMYVILLYFLLLEPTPLHFTRAVFSTPTWRRSVSGLLFPVVCTDWWRGSVMTHTSSDLWWSVSERATLRAHPAGWLALLAGTRHVTPPFGGQTTVWDAFDYPTLREVRETFHCAAKCSDAPVIFWKGVPQTKGGGRDILNMKLSVLKPNIMVASQKIY